MQKLRHFFGPFDSPSIQYNHLAYFLNKWWGGDLHVIRALVQSEVEGCKGLKGRLLDSKFAFHEQTHHEWISV